LKNNLILIIDKSSTNLLKRQEEIFQKWKINKEDVVKTTTWRKGLVQSKNLFGGVQAVWLDLSDAQAAMNFSKLIPFHLSQKPFNSYNRFTIAAINKVRSFPLNFFVLFICYAIITLV